jgi:hypothetical protein
MFWNGRIRRGKGGAGKAPVSPGLRRLPRPYLVALGLNLRRRLKPAFGSTDGVPAVEVGLTDGVLGAAAGSTGGALVVAVGSIGGK